MEVNFSLHDIFSIDFYFLCDIMEKPKRGVAQLVERVVWDHQAAGSNPVTPTSLLPASGS